LQETGKEQLLLIITNQAACRSFDSLYSSEPVLCCQSLELLNDFPQRCWPAQELIDTRQVFKLTSLDKALGRRKKRERERK